VLSQAYIKALRDVSQGTKVAFEMMLYALERRMIEPGETVYAVAGARSGWDTVVKFRVPKLVEFHCGGFDGFEVFGEVNKAAVARLGGILAQPNEFLPIILLYHPKAYPDRDYAWPPFSLLAVSSTVDRTKYYVYIIDNNLRCVTDYSAELAAIAYKLQIVGVSCMIGYQIVDMLQFLAQVRQACPGVPVVCGGPLPTILSELTLMHPYIDFVVRSQGEITFRTLLLSLDNPNAWGDILGLGFKKDGVSILNPLRPIHEKSSLPPYPFDLVDLGNYVRPAGVIGGRVLSYVSSQGCPFKCAFCSDMLIYQKKWISRTPDQIIGDLHFFRDVFGVDGIKFYDSNLLVSEARTRLFCKAVVDSGLGLNYAASMHPRVLSTLKEDTLQLLKTSGCKRLLVGAESGSDKELAMIRKGATVSDTIKCAERLRDLGIIGTFTLLIGLPRTNVEVLQSSVDLGRRISNIWPNHEVKMQVYQPYPGTELYGRFRVPGSYEPESLEEWSQEAFNTTPSAHKELDEYIQKVRRRHPQLFGDIEG